MSPRWSVWLFALGLACDPTPKPEPTDGSDVSDTLSDAGTDDGEDSDTDEPAASDSDGGTDPVTDAEPSDVASSDTDDIWKTDVGGETGLPEPTDYPDTGSGWGSDTWDPPSDSDALNPCGNAWEQQDCDGECWPKSWVNDGFCDDGTEKPWGDANYLCATYGNDGGDCDPEPTDDTPVDTAEPEPITDIWDPIDSGGTGPDDTSGASIDSDPCPPDAVPDCDGECASPQWVGDGYCDAGEDRAWGSPNLDCEAFNQDGGDCSTDAPVDTAMSPTDTAGCSFGYTADCDGECWPESWLGDGRCDDGAEQEWGSPNFDCRAMDKDNGDCRGQE